MFGYLIDMDGVIYRGHDLIPGADRFIQQLRADDVPFLFLTAYCDGSIFPPDLQDVPRLFKPYDDKAVAEMQAAAPQPQPA